MPYRSRTLRKMPQVTRKFARIIGELELITRRLKNLTEDIWMIERDSQALYKIHEAEPKDEVTGEGMDEIDKQMLSKASGDLTF